MPRGDGTGPMGMGPGTGRGFGPCTGYAGSVYAGYGPGFGRGRGCHRIAGATGLPGWQRFGYPDVDAESGLAQEKVLLENQVRLLENQLNQVKDQLKKIETKD